MDHLTGKPCYDLDYALCIGKLAGRTQPYVHIYSKMGLWENSVLDARRGGPAIGENKRWYAGR
jgi:hypothetical protein